MKKIFLSVTIFFLLAIIFIPIITHAAGLVPCGDQGENSCGITDFFQLLVNVYSFIVLQLAIPLGTLAVVVGGIFMLVSGGNPSMANRGKSIIKVAIIGLVLTFGSYLIINFILCDTLKFCNWSNPFG